MHTQVWEPLIHALEKHQILSCVTEVKSQQTHGVAGSPVADRVCLGACHLSFLWLFFFLPTKQWLMIVHTSHGLWWARNAGKCTEGLHNCENATGPQVTPAAFWMPAAPAAEQLDRKVQHFLNSPLKAWTAARLSPHLSKSISRLSAFASIRESFSPLPAAS